MSLGDGATPESPPRYQPANIAILRASYSMPQERNRCRAL